MVKFTKKVQEKFTEMSNSGKLFRVELSSDKIWELYLSSFSEENNPVFRDPNSTTKDCNHCKNFIRRYGNIVSVDENYEIVTMFDVDTDSEYENTAKVLSKAIKSSKITEVFFETFNELNSLPYESCSKSSSIFQLGVAKNPKRYTKEEAQKFGYDSVKDMYKTVKPNQLITFNHMHLFLDKQFVDATGDSVEKIMHKYREPKNVFKRCVETISIDTFNLVKDLINQGSLLNGATHVHKIEKMILFKKEFDKLSSKQKDNWCWVTSYKLPFAGFGNELIGTLCYELAEGMELNKACYNWNKREDPSNKMIPTAPFTERMRQDGIKLIKELGCEESFNRRLATIDDIKASEILHLNVGKGEIKEVSILNGLKSASTRHKRSEFNGIEEMSIEKFMKDILPTCTSVEAFLANTHEANMVSLTTAKNPDSKRIFKWDNNYSWTFNGNLAGKSQIKEAVKSRGGNVDGIVRVSLSFPDTTDDYDLHLEEPKGTHIYYSNVRQKHSSSGVLDLDAQGVDGNQPAEKRVENIIYTDKNSMPKGNYQIFVNNYSGRGLHTLFNLEIEIEGDITVLRLKNKKSFNKVLVAGVYFDGNSFQVKPSEDMEVIDSKSISKEIYGLETNKFHKVNLVCLSPNHWGNDKIGDKYYMFMLDECKSPVSVRGFHNENFIPELAAIRKVLEPLGATMMIESTENQLSGIGFNANATIKEELILKLKGTHQRTVKVNFK